MKIDVLPIGLYGENSYVLHDHDHVLFIDPGRYAGAIAEKVSDKETVDAVVLTHGHEDHVGAVDDLCDHYHVPYYIHPLDKDLIDPRLQTGSYKMPVYHEPSFLTEGHMTIGTFDLTIHHTPGHTQGSVLIQYRNVLFTGDTLFAGDIGRTDLFGGSEEDMTQSLQYIRTLADDLRVLPGHGPDSTIGQEKKTNAYLVMDTASLY